jgi:hypothetical protein
VKSTANAITRPPNTAVSLVDLRRQKATIRGAVANDTAKQSTPIQAENNKLHVLFQNND